MEITSAVREQNLMERLTNKKILVISDNPVLQGLLSSNISGESCFTVDDKDTFEELEVTLDRIRPDMIFIDAGMPQLDGIGLCLRLRCLYDIPVMVITTSRIEGDTVRGLDIINDCCLTEPLTIYELVTQLEETLEGNLHGEYFSDTVRWDGFGLLKGLPLSIQYLAAG